MGDAPGGSDDSPRGASRAGLLRRLVSWAPWAAAVLLAAWTRDPDPRWLPGAALLRLLPAVVPVRPPARPGLHAAGRLVLLAAVPLAFLAHDRLARLSADWDGYWSGRETEVFAELTDALEALVVRGDDAAAELAALAADSEGSVPPDALDRFRERTGFPAVAVYGPEGEALAWSGTHRGRVPEAAQLGAAPYLYGELPLFGYLYFTRPVPGTGGTAVAATLLRSELPEDLRARTGDFVTDFRARTGEEIRIARSERVGGRAAFDFVWDTGVGTDTLFSVSVVRPSEMERRAELRRAWVRVVFLLLVGGWALLAAAVVGYGEARRAVTALVFVAALLPLEALTGTSEWFRAGDFLLGAGPLDLTLGRLLLVLLAGVAAVAVWRARWERVPPVAAGVVVAAGFPAVAHVVGRAAAPGLLAGEDAGWIGFQLALAVALALVAAVAVGVARRPRGPGVPGARWGRLAVAVATALVLGAATAFLPAVEPGRRGLPLLMMAAWGLPAFMVARALPARGGWRRSLLTWACAVVLGGTAAIPVAWQMRTAARIVVAEEQMTRLGADVDPFLDFLLGRLAGEVRALDARGAGPVELLYRGWLESGLAEEGYPVWLTLWGPGGLPQEEFPIGVSGPRPPMASRLADGGRGADAVTVGRYELPDIHYAATVPLPDSSVVTAVVPPLREIRSGSPLGPLFGSLAGDHGDPLTLVPLLPGDPTAYGPTLTWERVDEGWQGEMLLAYADRRFHAHYLVDLPDPLVAVARATLLLLLDLAVVLVVWVAVRSVLVGSRPGRADLAPFVGSFRARITLALFGFFLLANAIFGTLAYRTISGAAERAARVLAERVARDGAAIYNQVGGEMELLGRQVGADLLEYRGGELREGSTDELVELGLFEGWLPRDVHARLESREGLLETRETRLGRWEYVTAYRRLPDGDILGAPIPLQAGATAVRREEVAHLLGFAVVAGGLLSLVLALLVGRALTRPIQTLQVASERVGAGNLGVRLPGNRSDEFGAVFTAFNRMVRRLRRARRDLVRTTRRTEAIVEDAATGVIALDPSARVTLANTRAAELLGREVEAGDRLRERGDAADEFVRWVKLYFRDGLRELGGEFHFGDRRVRVRARRIEREESRGGAVVSLEDVTDELRTERVLAWGEMARQVAHEVKNPLTPIKLAIQHIRRAWDDRRPDFGDILTRNADAALREIDRLAAIASSFSRFGAPEAAGASPLVAVELAPLVDEVMALYRSGEGEVRFETRVPADLPPARARASEVKEVLVNLLENARAAIDDAGRVCVEAERAGAGIVLRVLDDGGGIPADALPRVFEPHFSTRSAGTGLGLAIVKRLVESWDGTVSVESEPGKGTVVRLRLEAWPDAPEAGDGG